MVLVNLLGIGSEAELAREEERLSKLRPLEHFKKGFLGSMDVGTFAGLSRIHRHLFQDVDPCEGEVRTENIAKGSFRFAPAMYLDAALGHVERCRMALTKRSWPSTSR